MEKKCFISGLPNAGKTTFIAALWDIVRMRNSTALELQVTTNPDNTEYLNEIWSYWVKMKHIERSKKPIPDNIKINIKRVSDGEELVLDIPDFMGEQFQNIINRTLPENITAWIEQCDRMLYLINKFDEGNKDDIDEDEALEDPDRSKERKDALPLTPERMMETSQNLMVLKFISTHTKIKKIAIGLSAWDIKQSNGITPEQYLKQRSPVLYNFIKYHFEECLFFGVSAQGFDYEKNMDKIEDMYDKARKCERAFIAYGNEGNLSNDLTRPINYLIS